MSPAKGPFQQTTTNICLFLLAQDLIAQIAELWWCDRNPFIIQLIVQLGLLIYSSINIYVTMYWAQSCGGREAKIYTQVSRLVILTWVWFYPKGRFGAFQRKFWLLHRVGYATGFWRVEPKEAPRHPTRERTGPHNEAISGLKYPMLQFRNLNFMRRHYNLHSYEGWKENTGEEWVPPAQKSDPISLKI